ncbi:MAG: SEC-C metal-binding domain-containing protein [Acidobacteriota bacterium]
MAKEIGRNDPCPCGNGKKYKHCCIHTGGVEEDQRNKVATIGALLVVVAAIAVAFLFGQEPALATGVIGLLVVSAYRIFTDPPAPRDGGDPGAIRFGN